MTESGFFCDNALRQDGKLVLSGERTESCQYYAFFCDIVTPESHPWLWETLLHDFGYDRATRGLYPEIYPANAFIGNYLRLDLLDRYGCREALYDNIKGYFTYMADKTGTLWENVGDYASCNHGFASHVLYWMDHLGLLTRDMPGKDASAGARYECAGRKTAPRNVASGTGNLPVPSVCPAGWRTALVLPAPLSQRSLVERRGEAKRDQPAV